jgi:hypothetical protein
MRRSRHSLTHVLGYRYSCGGHDWNAWPAYRGDFLRYANGTEITMAAPPYRSFFCKRSGLRR